MVRLCFVDTYVIHFTAFLCFVFRLSLRIVGVTNKWTTMQTLNQASTFNTNFTVLKISRTLSEDNLCTTSSTRLKRDERKPN